MNSSLIGKIDKARRYAQEPDRVRFHDFAVSFRGDNDTYQVSFGEEMGWHCSCDYFSGHDICCHTMAMERLLGSMTPVGGRLAERKPAFV